MAQLSSNANNALVNHPRMMDWDQLQAEVLDHVSVMCRDQIMRSPPRKVSHLVQLVQAVRPRRRLIAPRG